MILEHHCRKTNNSTLSQIMIAAMLNDNAIMFNASLIRSLLGDLKKRPGRERRQPGRSAARLGEQLG